MLYHTKLPFNPAEWSLIRTLAIHSAVRSTEPPIKIVEWNCIDSSPCSAVKKMFLVEWLCIAAVTQHLSPFAAVISKYNNITLRSKRQDSLFLPKRFRKHTYFMIRACNCNGQNNIKNGALILNIVSQKYQQEHAERVSNAVKLFLNI